jgi:hypothetical protein
MKRSKTSSKARNTKRNAAPPVRLRQKRAAPKTPYTLPDEFSPNAFFRCFPEQRRGNWWLWFGGDIPHFDRMNDDQHRDAAFALLSGQPFPALTLVERKPQLRRQQKRAA